MLHANETGIKLWTFGPLAYVLLYLSACATKLFKSELFSCLPKVDQMINSYKGPISSIYPMDIILFSGKVEKKNA